jgi:hypothetical protein
MRRLLVLALTAGTVLLGLTGSSRACEKHLNGHQNGSDTDVEGRAR